LLAITILEILFLAMVVTALIIGMGLDMTRDKRQIIKQNKELIAKYPFLALKSYDFDNDIYYIPDDYDYMVTWLDFMPEGWYKAFGLQLCEELKEALDEYNYADKYIIDEVKEKYGELRIYDTGIPQGCRVWDVIKKYTDLSRRTCITCGAPATKMSLGWISPYCDKCADEMKGQYIDIDGDPFEE